MKTRIARYDLENEPDVENRQIIRRGPHEYLEARQPGDRRLSRKTRALGLHNTKSGALHPDASVPITAREYGTFQKAFDYFGEKLFASALPQVLITFQRKARAKGYFSAKKFHHRGDGSQYAHEIALNPDAFVGRSDEEILSTFVHEMVHLWQKEFGHSSGRGHYHNREWGTKMRSIGLAPSATGEPGGAETGDHMSHYILEGGPFQRVCATFLEQYQLVWESALVAALPPSSGGSNGSGSDGDGGSLPPGGEAPKQPTRAKFVCPIPGCSLAAWAKPSAELACVRCSKETGELIPMQRVEQVHKTKGANYDAR